MSEIIFLKTKTDKRGSLTFIENEVKFKIKRVYFLYNLSKYKRGGHRHRKTQQALIAINGSCKVLCDNGTKKKTVKLNRQNKCLILEPKDWHILSEFTKNTVVLVLASKEYDCKDYIYEGYK